MLLFLRLRKDCSVNSEKECIRRWENDKQYNSKFLKLWESNEVELVALNQYFTSHPEIFEEYFKYHCPNTKERLSNAINLYPAKIEDIRIIAESLPIIIQEVTNAYHNKFNFDVKMKFHLFVGGFGSNAFVEREIIGDMFLPQKNYLQI